ncbi:MAG: hypothetical protein ACTSUC_06355 [Promethearchaeota archaeon]
MEKNKGKEYIVKSAEGMFCINCKSMLRPVKSLEGKIKNEKQVDLKKGFLYCTQCDEYYQNNLKSIKESDKTLDKEVRGVIVTSADDDPDLVDIHCPECNSERVYMKNLPARWRDGEETQIYRCPKCNHSWRTGGED